MNSNKKTARILDDVKINVKIKLSILWIMLMFCYLYADVITLYGPGFIEEIMSGKVVGFQINQVFLLGVAILMTIPVVMIFLSLTLKAKANRWVSIIAGIFHAGILIATIFVPSTIPSFVEVWD